MKSILANSILSSAQAREVDLSFNYANKLPKGSKFVVETMDECCIDWATATDATTNTALPRVDSNKAIYGIKILPSFSIFKLFAVTDA